MEGEVLTAPHVRRSLNHEKAVVIVRTEGSHEWTHADKTIRGFEAQTLGIERLGLNRVRHEVHDMGQAPRQGRHIGRDSQLIDRALWCATRCVREVGGCAEVASHTDLKGNGEARIIHAVQRAFTIPSYLAIT